MKLNGRQRDRYVVMCASIDTIQEFCSEKSFQEFTPNTKRIIKTILTNMRKMRDEVPGEIDLQSCKSLLHDIKNYKLQLTYSGNHRYYVNGGEIDDLMQYAIMGMCKSCEKTGKAVKKCEFKKTWYEALAETDFEQRSGECEYSFKPYSG